MTPAASGAVAGPARGRSRGSRAHGKSRRGRPPGFCALSGFWRGGASPAPAAAQRGSGASRRAPGTATAARRSPPPRRPRAGCRSGMRHAAARPRASTAGRGEQEQAFEHRHQAQRRPQVASSRRAAQRSSAQVLQERIVAVQHDHRVAVGERLAVGLQAAVEGVERRDRGRRRRRRSRGARHRLRRAASARRARLRRAITACSRSASARIVCACSSPSARSWLATCWRCARMRSYTDADHVAVLRQVDALDAHVDDLDAERAAPSLIASSCAPTTVGAVAGDHLLQRARVDLVAQRVLDDRRQALRPRPLRRRRWRGRTRARPRSGRWRRSRR